MWSGVDFLFIDKISMVGCDLLLCISEALIEAKGCTEPFGGINMIFAGDFAQLSPVGQTRLFARQHAASTAHAATVKGQRTTLGKLLWLTVSSVIILSEIMRQKGNVNDRFLDLLE